ncbi:MAG: AAA family ATPase [SAR324 cluster bacterium]|nr:AAA family ATPase [SAR324 cluster bacterium]
MELSKKIRNIAYGVSDFEKLQSRNDYFVDKTHFIPALEKYDYVFFIRPRRFGKSLWLSILETYYDIAKKERFAEFFHDTWILRHPTEERGTYLMLPFNFSAVIADPKGVRNSFESYCEIQIHGTLDKYRSYFPEGAIDFIQQKPTAHEKLSALFKVTSKNNLSLFILIDEYDNFANTILSSIGENAYYDLTHGEGFYRNFFAVLKAGTSGSGGGLKRLFITGVSPVTLDDVTSGFNMGKNISLEPHFNEMVGFTEPEVRTMLEYYQKEGVFKQEIEPTLELMRVWYNNYYFHQSATVSLFNTDMVIYFVQISVDRGTPPDELIDNNIRIDYNKLRHLLLINLQSVAKLNGNFDLLKSLLEDGETTGRILSSFPVKYLTKPDSFMSLLYYFGLLSYAGVREGEPLLKIPNRAVWELMYGYLREAWDDTEVFRLNLWKLAQMIHAMAWHAKWREFFEFLGEQIKIQTSIRDYLSAEKVVQGFLLAYLNVSHFYITRPEREMNKGFADIFLEPFLAQYPEIPYAYLLEVKYFKRDEMTESKLQQVVQKAKDQLTLYLQDEIITQQYAQVKTLGLVIVFHGWELVYLEQVCKLGDAET